MDAVFERAASNQRISVHHEAGLTHWLPMSFVQKMRTIPGVSGINQFSWFGGIYDEPKNMFPNFAVDPETVEQVWPDYGIAPEALDRFKRLRNGALVGAELMTQFGWRLGQLVTLRGTVFPVDLTLEIVGTIPSGSGTRMLWFGRTYLEEAMEPKGGMKNVGMIWLRAERPELVDGIIAGAGLYSLKTGGRPALKSSEPRRNAIQP